MRQPSRATFGVAAPILATLLFSAPPCAHAQKIGIFADPEGVACAAEVGDVALTELHVLVLLEGDLSEFSTAQFRVGGLPSTWTPSNTFWVYDPAVGIAFGNPLFTTSFDERSPGAVVTFKDFCQGDGAPPGDVTPIPIGRIIVAGAPTPENTTLRVMGYSLVVVDPNCPFLIDCTDFNAKRCVEGGSILLNPRIPTDCEVAILTAVEEFTWSGVKSLFR